MFNIENIFFQLEKQMIIVGSKHSNILNNIQTGQRDCKVTFVLQEWLESIILKKNN